MTRRPSRTKKMSRMVSIVLLLSFSENILYMTLGKKLMAAGKEKLFQTWMLEESDLVQGAAHAYGE